jgi:hypothetical protein
MRGHRRSRQTHLSERLVAPAEPGESACRRKCTRPPPGELMVYLFAVAAERDDANGKEEQAEKADFSRTRDQRLRLPFPGAVRPPACAAFRVEVHSGQQLLHHRLGGAEKAPALLAGGIRSKSGLPRGTEARDREVATSDCARGTQVHPSRVVARDQCVDRRLLRVPGHRVCEYEEDCRDAEFDRPPSCCQLFTRQRWHGRGNRDTCLLAKGISHCPR